MDDDDGTMTIIATFVTLALILFLTHRATSFFYGLFFSRKLACRDSSVTNSANKSSRELSAPAVQIKAKLLIPSAKRTLNLAGNPTANLTLAINMV